MTGTSGSLRPRHDALGRHPRPGRARPVAHRRHRSCRGPYVLRPRLGRHDGARLLRRPAAVHRLSAALRRRSSPCAPGSAPGASAEPESQAALGWASAGLRSAGRRCTRLRRRSIALGIAVELGGLVNVDAAAAWLALRRRRCWRRRQPRCCAPSGHPTWAERDRQAPGCRDPRHRGHAGRGAVRRRRSLSDLRRRRGRSCPSSSRRRSRRGAASGCGVAGLAVRSPSGTAGCSSWSRLRGGASCSRSPRTGPTPTCRSRPRS